MFHPKPNVYADGGICSDISHNRWSLLMCVSHISISMTSELTLIALCSETYSSFSFSHFRLIISKWPIFTGKLSRVRAVDEVVRRTKLHWVSGSNSKLISSPGYIQVLDPMFNNFVWGFYSSDAGGNSSVFSELYTSTNRGNKQIENMK